MLSHGCGCNALILPLYSTTLSPPLPLPAEGSRIISLLLDSPPSIYAFHVGVQRSHKWTATGRGRAAGHRETQDGWPSYNVHELEIMDMACVTFCMTPRRKSTQHCALLSAAHCALALGSNA